MRGNVARDAIYGHFSQRMILALTAQNFSVLTKTGAAVAASIPSPGPLSRHSFFSDGGGGDRGSFARQRPRFGVKGYGVTQKMSPKRISIRSSFPSFPFVKILWPLHLYFLVLTLYVRPLKRPAQLTF